MPLIIAGGAGGINFSKLKDYDKSFLSLTNASYTTKGNSGINDIVKDGGGKDGNGGGYNEEYYLKIKNDNDKDKIKIYNFGSGGGFKTDGKSLYNGDITTIYYYG